MWRLCALRYSAEPSQPPLLVSLVCSAGSLPRFRTHMHGAIGCGQYRGCFCLRNGTSQLVFTDASAARAQLHNPRSRDLLGCLGLFSDHAYGAPGYPRSPLASSSLVHVWCSVAVHERKVFLFVFNQTVRLNPIPLPRSLP